MFVLGINLSHHSSIALIENNQVLLFVQEDRLNKHKYYRGIPYKALDHVKKYTKCIDYVSFVSGLEDNLTIIIKYLESQGVDVKGYECSNEKHHLGHASAGFYMSHFDEASVFVVDGAGSLFPLLYDENGKIDKSGSVSETISIYKGEFPNLTCYSKKFVAGLYGMNIPGKPQPKIPYHTERYKKFRRYWAHVPDVTITTELDIGWRYALATRDIGFGLFGDGKTMGLSAYARSGTNMGAKAVTALRIQEQLEEYFVNMILKAKSNNIVISGGCALNILANSKIKMTYPNLNIYIDPIAADGTIALGAATNYYYTTSQDKNKLVFNAYQGPEYLIDKNFIYECTRKYSI